jgi:hypothetical protein
LCNTVIAIRWSWLRLLCECSSRSNSVRGEGGERGGTAAAAASDAPCASVSCCLRHCQHSAWPSSLARDSQWWQRVHCFCSPGHPRPVENTSTAAGERVPSCAASAVVVQWSISLLTFVELDMLSATQRLLLPSLHMARQAQRVSAHCTPHAMRTLCVHAAACHSPCHRHSSMRRERKSEHAATAGAEISVISGSIGSNNTAINTHAALSWCSTLSRMATLLSLADHCWWRTGGAKNA